MKLTGHLIDAICHLYQVRKLSIPQVAEKVGIGRTAVRGVLIRCGVRLRTRQEGVLLRSEHLSRVKVGKPHPHTEEWNKKISESKLAWGEKNAAGVSLKSRGYVEFTRGPNKGRFVHVVVMEESIGRRLLPNEVVHHIDENRANNAIDNLVLMKRGAHSRLHRYQDRMRGKKRSRSTDGRFG